MTYHELQRAVRSALGPAFIDGLAWVVSRRDWQGAQRLGRQFGEFGWKHDRRHRSIALKNIRLAYGDEIAEDRVQEIARGCMLHTTTLFVEALRLTGMSAEECREVVTVQGEHHLQEAIAAGNGVVMFAGHLGNWEVGAVRLIHDDYPIIPLSRPPRSRRLARKFKEVRDRLNFPVIPVSEGMRGIFRALKENYVVPVMPDRFAKGQGVTVPFFGRDTHVWQTPALLHSRTNCAVVPSHAFRRGDGSFCIEIDAPVTMQDTGDREADIVANTATLMAVLEQKVRSAPEQYAWHYELWREPPAADAVEVPDMTAH
ncbi:MAG: lysophospholipid acyltransferase family protein [Bacteroidota bacterium]